MKWTFAGTMAPYFAARRNGVFHAAGIEPEIRSGGIGNSSISQVIAEKADFGITGAHDLAMARAQDQPLVSVAVIFRRSPTCLVVLEDSRITRPEQLAGKTIELTRDDNSEIEVLAMLAKAGVVLKEEQRRPYRFIYDALIAHRVDAIVAYENDQAVTLAAQHKIAVISPAENGVTPYADVLFTTEAMTKSNPQLVARVVEGMLNSWIWAADNVETCVDMFISDDDISKLSLDRTTQLAVLRASLKYVIGPASSRPSERVGFQELERWNETISLIRTYGNGTGLKLPKPEDCFTNRWVGLFEIRKKESAPVTATTNPK